MNTKLAASQRADFRYPLKVHSRGGGRCVGATLDTACTPSVIRYRPPRVSASQEAKNTGLMWQVTRSEGPHQIGLLSGFIEERPSTVLVVGADQGA